MTALWSLMGSFKRSPVRFNLTMESIARKDLVKNSFGLI